MTELAFISGVALIVFSAIWVHQKNMREEREKFKRELQGYKFGSLKELKAYWKGTMDISFGTNNNEFDPNYHGNLLETLRHIDEAVRKELKRWNS